MVGRKREVEELNRLYKSNRAEFVAVHGRIGVGKTHLVEETFNDKFAFRHTGLSPMEVGKEKNILAKQLESFYNSLLLYGMPEAKCPSSWLEAIFLLEKFLMSKDDGSRQLVFIDELPWLDTPRSGFVTALESFWNNWACHRSNFMLIVCGSASSWIINRLVNNHGGLYGRLTYELKVSPFTLKETEEFFLSNDIALSRYDIAQSYMIFGGIPFYLGYFQKGMSLAQNVDEVFFSHHAPLRIEFDRLFQSVFDNPARAKAIVTLLNSRNAGFTRQEISQKTGIGDGGGLTETLAALVASDFIIKYVPFGLSKRDVHYKLIDPFCLFFLKFVDSQDSLASSFWQDNISSQSIVTWRGLAFENVCFNHIPQIKKALGISGVSTVQSAWSKRPDDTEGTQIDLLIQRKDNIVNMCEVKFLSDEFAVDYNYYRTLLRRQNLIMEKLPRKMAVHTTLITTFGLVYNAYSGVFTNTLTLEDLFA